MIKHTPGPWKISGSPYSRDVVYEYDNSDGLGSREGKIAALGVPGNHDELMLANAALIAAAPEMLDALNVALDAIAAHGTYPGDIYLARKVIKEAIAKAEGRV